MTVYKKIAQVMGKVAYLQKDTKSQGYTAITHNKVTDAVREHCQEAGLLMIPFLHSEEVVPIPRQGKADGVRYRCVYDFSLVDAESGEQTTTRVSAHADDFGDKAPGKALSYAMKSAMLKIFMIPSGDDDEERVEFDKEKKRLMNQLVDEDQIKKLREAMTKAGITDEQFNQVMGCPSVERLQSARFEGAMKRLAKKAEEAQQEK